MKVWLKLPQKFRLRPLYRKTELRVLEVNNRVVNSKIELRSLRSEWIYLPITGMSALMVLHVSLRAEAQPAVERTLERFLIFMDSDVRFEILSLAKWFTAGGNQAAIRLNAIVHVHVGSHARFTCEALRAAWVLTLEGFLGQIGILLLLHYFHRYLLAIDSFPLLLLLPSAVLMVVLFLFHRRCRRRRGASLIFLLAAEGACF